MGMNGSTTATTKMNLLAVPGEPGADGTTDVETTIDYLDVQQSGELFPTGGGPDLSQSNKALAKGVRGKSFNAQVDAGGYVVSLSGTEALVDGALAELENVEFPPEAGDAAKKVVADIVKQQFNDDAMKNMVEYFVMPRSLEKLDPGTTWSRSGNVDFGMMPATGSYTFTVSERTETEVYINESSTYEFDPSAPSMISMMQSNPDIQSLGDMKFELSGTGTGTYVVDLATGWAVSNNGTIDLKGKLTAGPLNADITVNVAQDFTSVPK